MRVLYVNHTAQVSGGERSLLILLESIAGEAQVVVAAPRGPLWDAVQALGIETAEIRGTAGSMRLHPLHTPRALGEMSLAAAELSAIARRNRPDVVHANSIRGGIVAGLTPLHGAARVVHVRDCLPPGPATTATMRLIAARADVVIANSSYTARFVAQHAPRASISVVHNPVDMRRFDPALVARADMRKRLGAGADGCVLLGVVAQLSPWKGQETAIEALRILRSEGVDAQLLLIGSAKFTAQGTRFDNEAYVRRLHALVARHALQDHVAWLGEREDVPDLVGALDVLLLPSQEEPFGRALIEAMALEVPVIATDVGGPPDILAQGREGYLLAPGQPELWAQGVRRILESPDHGAAMGRAGRERVLDAFTPQRHVEQVLSLYRRATA
jgi:glycosyltransferase involved in cell wall biosynthesis